MIEWIATILFRIARGLVGWPACTVFPWHHRGEHVVDLDGRCAWCRSKV